MKLDEYIVGKELDEEKLLSFGFKKDGTKLLYKYEIEDAELYALFSYSCNNFEVFVYDYDDEKYSLFDNKGEVGSFVSSLRSIIEEKAEKIVKECRKENSNNKNEVIKYFKEKYSTEGEKTFGEGEYSDYLVFRAENNKWAALIMDIKQSLLFGNSDKKVDVINLKHREDDIPKIIDNKYIFECYHMSKKHWITVLLSSDIPLSYLKELIDESYEMVSKKR